MILPKAPTEYTSSCLGFKINGRITGIISNAILVEKQRDSHTDLAGHLGALQDTPMHEKLPDINGSL
jgi:hypothetical protein